MRICPGFLLAALAMAGAASASSPAPFVAQKLSAGPRLQLTALVREPAEAPARYEVFVIPGSGCAGLAPIAERYFRGLMHARVIVLQKPFVKSGDWPAPACGRRFTQWDNLPAWREAAATAIQAWRRAHPTDLPQLLVGISEGGELIAALAPELPQLRGLVLIGSAGLDPAVVAEAQAAREGDADGWRAVQGASLGSARDAKLLDGRTLRYWRTLLGWQVEQPLLAAAVPLLQAWGMADEAVPPQSYRQFQEAARKARPDPARYCAMPIEGADHGLQKPGHDGLQQVWAQLESWARGGAWCGEGAKTP